MAVESLAGTGSVEVVRLADRSALPADVAVIGVPFFWSGWSGERVTGALGLNQPRPVMRLRAMIAHRASWSEALEFAQAASARSFS